MLLSEIEITGKEEEILKSREYISVESLIRREPLRYYDFSETYFLYTDNEVLMNKIENKEEIAITGILTNIEKSFKNKKSIIKIRVKEDYSGNTLFINILGQYKKYAVYKEYLNKRVIAGGYIEYSEQYRCFSMMNPILLSTNIMEMKKIHPQYGTIKNISEEYFKKKLDQGIEQIGTMDFLPPEILAKYNLPSFKHSACMMHHPKTYKDIEVAKKRTVFEDLIYLATKLELQKLKETKHPGLLMEQESYFHSYLNNLPYSLTKDQEEVITSISKKMTSGTVVNSLVQGDVGTGKTIVAISLLIKAAENGFQSVLIAPYTTLAAQHYAEIKEAADKFGIKTALITSEMNLSQRKKIIKEIETGNISIIVGTHSVFSKTVKYYKLGLIITDEEHKFGVMHRDYMKEKAIPGFHQIIMSATPIPRSLAETMYGEQIDVMTIMTKPANRIPIQTALCKKDETALQFLLKEIQSGHQAYVVCPSIDKNEKSTSIEEKEPIYKNFFESHGYKVGVLTGKTKANEKQILMEDFKKNNIQILIATTVIEVGINVPNATCIVITGAERFGFSTLHQLRGRVGRGNLKSYCILQTEKQNEKLQFICSETDGFKIALKDLELRGPGSLYGDKQTGNDYYVKLMLAYPNMYKVVKQIAVWMCKTNNGNDMVERYESLFVTN